MQKTYTYNPRDYFMQITFVGSFSLLILVFCIVMVSTGNQPKLFAFAGVITIYTAWNTFVSHSNPSQLLLEEDGISFSSYGRTDKYLFTEIKSFMVKDFRGSGKMFIRVNDSGLMKGRYWVHTARFNDSDELFLYLLQLEYATHPMSIKARAWDSTRPGVDKTPLLPWEIPNDSL